MFCKPRNHTNRFSLAIFVFSCFTLAHQNVLINLSGHFDFFWKQLWSRKGRNSPELVSTYMHITVEKVYFLHGIYFKNNEIYRIILSLFLSAGC